MVYYGGLDKNKVMEIYYYCMGLRKGEKFGQRKIFKSIKEKFGVQISEGTISGWIFSNNKPFEQEKTQFKPKKVPEREELEKIYHELGRSAQDLAREKKVSAVTAIKWLKKRGIEPRKHQEAMNTQRVKKILAEQKIIRPTKRYNLLSKEKAYVLGVICGDGCLTNNVVRLEIRKDEEFIKKFAECFSKIYGLDYNYKYYNKRNSFVLQISSIIIAQDIARYSSFGTKNWRVPKEIIQTENQQLICSFLRGFYDSEGSVSRSSISASSINIVGLEEVSILLNKIGIKSTLRPMQKRYHILHIFRKGRFEIFRDLVGFTIKRKQEKIEEVLNTGFFSKRSRAD